MMCTLIIWRTTICALPWSWCVVSAALRFPRRGDASEARLGFVIVDDKKRGRGYGKQMVCLAVQYAFDVLNVQKVSLGVFENNIPAIGYYRACGFREVQLEQTEQYSCLGQVWKCIEMQRQR